MIAPIPAQRDAAWFWLELVLIGLGTGLAAAALTGLLELVQHTVWPRARRGSAASRCPRGRLVVSPSRQVIRRHLRQRGVACCSFVALIALACQPAIKPRCSNVRYRTKTRCRDRATCWGRDAMACA